MMYRVILLIALITINNISGLVVGAPAKLTLSEIKPSKLLVLISHNPTPAVISAHVLSHEHVTIPVIHTEHVHPAAAIEIPTTAAATAPITHTITQINHHETEHPIHTVHPVNGHSLGYSSSSSIAVYTPSHNHENIYTVHVGGYGVGLNVGGHGHGHGYFALF